MWQKKKSWNKPKHNNIRNIKTQNGSILRIINVRGKEQKGRMRRGDRR